MHHDGQEMQSGLRPATTAEARLGEGRQAQWAKFDAMMSSVRAACARHLDIIRTEQSRVDEELAARNLDAGAGQ